LVSRSRALLKSRVRTLLSRQKRTLKHGTLVFSITGKSCSRGNGCSEASAGLGRARHEIAGARTEPARNPKKDVRVYTTRNKTKERRTTGIKGGKNKSLQTQKGTGTALKGSSDREFLVTARGKGKGGGAAEWAGCSRKRDEVAGRLWQHHGKGAGRPGNKRR